MCHSVIVHVHTCAHTYTVKRCLHVDKVNDNDAATAAMVPAAAFTAVVAMVLERLLLLPLL